ncbi:MAG TPA: DPP IV N-terminal domain-containing protein, partial [Gemmatimonadaceae bacterium]
MRKLLQGLLLLFAALPLAAQQSRPFDFSIKNIMRGPELYGRQPDNVRWSADSRWIYFTWLEPGTDWRETPKQFRVRAVPGAKPERVSIQQVDSTGYRFAPTERSHNGRYSVVEFNGDLFINDLTTGTIRRLTQTIESEHAPQFSANDREIFFVRSNNIYSIDLSSGFLRQVTDIRPGPAPTDSSRAQGQRGRLEQQQRDLFESVRDRIRADSIARLDRLQRDSLGLRPVYLQSAEQVSDFSISPTGTSLLITTRTPATGNRTTDIPQYVTRTGYTEELRVRTKVGDAEQRGRVALITLPAATVTWLKIFSSDTTTGAFDLLGWNDAGTRALLYAYSGDNKTRLLQTVDPAGGLTTLEEARDTAWVGGPCGECGGWYGGGAGRVWYVSEVDGFSHLYTIAPDGSGKQQLTKGKWEVREVTLSSDDRWFYLQTNQVSPFEQHLYRMPTAGGPIE